MIHIPFDHIKTLPNGNYGCTLQVGGKSYCAIYTSDWQVIEPLHEVEQDPYSDYTYFRDNTQLPITSHYCGCEIHDIDSKLAALLGYKDGQDVEIDVEEYINGTAKLEEDCGLLFTVKYLDKDYKEALSVPHTLTPYRTFATAAIRSIFNLYLSFECNANAVKLHLGIDHETTDPIQRAALQLIRWIDFVHCKAELLSDKDYLCCLEAEQSPYKNLLFDLVEFIFRDGFREDMCADGLLDFPRLLYVKYLAELVPQKCAF